MKFIHDRQELEHMLITMHNEGCPIRELMRRFHMGRNTVRRILRKHGRQRDEGHDVLRKKLKRLSKLDAFTEDIEKILDKYPGITGVRVHEKLTEAGYTGGITILRERLGAA